MTTYDPSPPSRGVPAYPGGSDVSLSGLTEIQAKEFNRLFLVSFAVFTLIAILAHIAAWSWRPWGHETSPTQARQPVAAVSTLLPSASPAPRFS